LYRRTTRVDHHSRERSLDADSKLVSWIYNKLLGTVQIRLL
jgi:hypothetical protein